MNIYEHQWISTNIMNIKAYICMFINIHEYVYHEYPWISMNICIYIYIYIYIYVYEYRWISMKIHEYQWIYTYLGMSRSRNFKPRFAIAIDHQHQKSPTASGRFVRKREFEIPEVSGRLYSRVTNLLRLMAPGQRRANITSTFLLKVRQTHLQYWTNNHIWCKKYTLPS